MRVSDFPTCCCPAPMTSERQTDYARPNKPWYRWHAGGSCPALRIIRNRHSGKQPRNAVSVQHGSLLRQNFHNGHPIACPQGKGVSCKFSQYSIFKWNILVSAQGSLQYPVLFNRVITSDSGNTMFRKLPISRGPFRQVINNRRFIART